VEKLVSVVEALNYLKSLRIGKRESATSVLSSELSYQLRRYFYERLMDWMKTTGSTSGVHLGIDPELLYAACVTAHGNLEPILRSIEKEFSKASMALDSWRRRSDNT